jgi:Metallo-peptidase family M12B Reprolysin-like
MINAMTIDGERGLGSASHLPYKAHNFTTLPINKAAQQPQSTLQPQSTSANSTTLTMKTSSPSLAVFFTALAMDMSSQVTAYHHVHTSLHQLFDRTDGEEFHLDFEAFTQGGRRALQASDSSRKSFVVTHGAKATTGANAETFQAHNEHGETVHLVRMLSEADDATTLVGSLVSHIDETVYEIYTDHAGQTRMEARHTSSFPPEMDAELVDHEEESNNDNRNLKQAAASASNARSNLRRGLVNAVDTESRNLQTTPIIDVMVPWTLNSECANSRLPAGCTPTATTTANIQAKIALAISETNQAYTNSGINARVRLAHSYRLAGYTESGAATALNNLGAVDGVIDDVHIIRQQVGADAVVLFMVEAATCGKSWVSGTPVKASGMFSVVAWDCATGQYSFGHEFNHAMGCNHDRGAKAACTSTETAFGFRSKMSPVRDVMGLECQTGQCDNNPYSTCTRVAAYSGLANTQWGVLGDANNNCAGRINSVASSVAALFSPPGATPLATPAPTRAPTVAPTTARPTTARPTTARPTTARPTTARPTTARPTTARPTTARPTTARPTTAAPTTARPTTAPTAAPTAAPTTAKPTTAAPTTARPTTAAPTTARPTASPTARPTTAPTAAPTVAPTTAKPTTAAPTLV